MAPVRDGHASRFSAFGIALFELKAGLEVCELSIDREKDRGLLVGGISLAFFDVGLERFNVGNQLRVRLFCRGG